MKSKKLKEYLILLGYLILLTIGFCVSSLIDKACKYDYFSYLGIYILAILPIAVIIYGSISYSLTKQIILPNLLLLLFVSSFTYLPLLLTSVFDEDVSFSFSLLFEELRTAGSFVWIVPAVSVFFFSCHKVYIQNF